MWYVICFVVGLYLGGKFAMWFVNMMIENDMKNGDAFLFRKGKWFPHNPRDGYSAFAKEK